MKTKKNENMQRCLIVFENAIKSEATRKAHPYQLERFRKWMKVKDYDEPYLIPLPIVSLVILTRNKALMGAFVNRKITTVVASRFVGMIVILNVYLLVTI